MSRLVPTSVFDASLFAPDSRSRVVLGIAPFDHTATDMAAKRASVDSSVRACSLYPIIPMGMRLGPVDMEASDITEAWRQAMWPMGYVTMNTSLETYTTRVLRGQTNGFLGMFGTTHNAIEPVVDLADKLHKPKLLMHYVMAVSLQFYLSVRNLFMVTRVDKGAPFNESLPPYVFIMFRSLWKVNLKPDDPSVHTNLLDEFKADGSSVHKEALRRTFPVFLFIVLRSIQERFPVAARLTQLGAEKDNVVYFCLEKLRKNYFQGLMCMRFREMLPANACDVLGPGASNCIIKFFPHPKAATIETLNTKDTPDRIVERAAQLFTHCFFAPNHPIFSGSDAPVNSLWEILLYLPLSDFDKTVSVTARRVFGVLPQAPGADTLNLVRARYTCYVQDDTVYAFVPNLFLAAEGVWPHDEQEVSTMSALAWEWLCNNGDPDGWEHAAWPVQYTPLERSLWGSQLARPTNAYHYFAAVRALSGSEATAAAMCRKIGFELDAVRVAYSAYKDEQYEVARRIIPADMLRWLWLNWDRCSVVDASRIPASLRHIFTRDDLVNLKAVWKMMFPVAAIGFGSSQWIDHWQPRESMPQTAKAHSAIRCILSRPELEAELLAAPMPLTSKQASAVTLLRSLLFPPSVKEEEMSD